MGVELRYTQISVEKDRYADRLVTMLETDRPPPQLSLLFGVTTNLDVEERKPLDELIIGALHRSIFEYIDDIYKAHNKGAPLIFDAGRYEDEGATYYQANTTPSFRIEVSSKTEENEKIPDYKVTISLDRIPLSHWRYKRRLTKNVGRELPDKMKRWMDLILYAAEKTGK